MSDNEKKFSQISLSFDPGHPVETTAEEARLNDEVGQAPINVGIRIKAFKEAIQPSPVPIPIGSHRINPSKSNRRGGENR